MKGKKTLLLFLTLVLAVGLVAFAMTGCKPKPPATAGGEIVIGTTEKYTQIDPAQSYDFFTWELFQNIYYTLLVYTPGTTDLVPGLAAEMPTSSADFTEWTFKLRDGLKFSNGTPITAETVKYQIDRVMKTELDPSWLVTAYVDRVEVVDPLTVKFVMKDTCPYFPALVATPPYAPVDPAVYPLDKIVPDPSAFNCTGPYMVEKFVRDEEIVLVKNPNYYGTAALNDKVIIKFYSDATTLRLAVENGDIDVAWKALNPSDIADLRKNPNLKVIEASGAQIRFLCFVCNGDPFKEKILREAVAAAVDRAPIVDKVFLGTVDPLYSMVPIGMWSHKDSFEDEYGEYNVEKAKELLKGLGYDEANPFSFELWYTPSHYGDTEADVALLLKQGFEATGVMKVELKVAEWGTYTENFDKGNMSAFLLGWYPDYIDPDDYTAVFALTEASKGQGIFYSDPKMDELLVKAQVTTGKKDRTKLYEEIQDYWAKEVPTCPIFQGKLALVTQPYIEGIAIGPTMIFNYDVIYRTK
jgi:peptide/nickel transport system substrate-binding protein